MRTTLKISPLRLTVVVDYDSMFRELNVTGVMIIILCAVCIIGFIIIAYIISRYMVHPIEHLSRKMSSPERTYLDPVYQIFRPH